MTAESPGFSRGEYVKAKNKVLTDRNGVNFLQAAAFRVNKDKALNIRITEETKINIDYLTRKHGLSQSDLITVLVEEAVRKEMAKEAHNEKL